MVSLELASSGLLTYSLRDFVGVIIFAVYTEMFVWIICRYLMYPAGKQERNHATKNNRTFLIRKIHEFFCTCKGK